MTIQWMSRARRGLKQTSTYIKRSFGKNVFLKFHQNISHTISLLESNPEMGRLDPLLASRKRAYRSLVVNKFNKIVYFVEGEVVVIAAFWDTRSEPQSQVEGLE